MYKAAIYMCARPHTNDEYYNHVKSTMIKEGRNKPLVRVPHFYLCYFKLRFRCVLSKRMCVKMCFFFCSEY